MGSRAVSERVRNGDILIDYRDFRWTFLTSAFPMRVPGDIIEDHKYAVLVLDQGWSIFRDKVAERATVVYCPMSELDVNIMVDSDPDLAGVHRYSKPRFIIAGQGDNPWFCVFELDEENEATGTVHFYCSEECRKASEYADPEKYREAGGERIAHGYSTADKDTVCETCLCVLERGNP